VEAPPDPGSHILPTPGQTPLELELDAAVDAPAVDDVSATEVPARITVANANGSADFRSWISPLQNILIPPRVCLQSES
jgi:hypothetical protein